MKKLFIMAAVAMVAMTACSKKDNAQDQVEGEEIEIVEGEVAVPATGTEQATDPSLVDQAKEAVSNAVDQAKTAAGEAYDNAKTAATEAVTNAANSAAAQAADAAAQAARNAVNNAATAVGNAVSNAVK